MKFTNRTGIKVLVVVVSVGTAGIVADWRLAASPSPSLVSPWKPDNLPRVEVVRPRRAMVAQRLRPTPPSKLLRKQISSPRSPDTCPMFASISAITSRQVKCSR